MCVLLGFLLWSMRHKTSQCAVAVQCPALWHVHGVYSSMLVALACHGAGAGAWQVTSNDVVVVSCAELFHLPLNSSCHPLLSLGTCCALQGSSSLPVPGMPYPHKSLW